MPQNCDHDLFLKFVKGWSSSLMGLVTSLDHLGQPLAGSRGLASHPDGPAQVHENLGFVVAGCNFLKDRLPNHYIIH